MKNNIALILIVSVFVLLSSCGSGGDQQQTISEKQPEAESTTKNVGDNQIKETDNSNTIQSSFVSKKVEAYREQINSGATATEIKEKQSSLTKSLLREQNNQLTDWTGEITGPVDMFHDTELDIGINIKEREIVGQRTVSNDMGSMTFDCGISIDAEQIPSKKYGFKGIVRSGELYEKVKNLQEGDKVIFSAKVVDVWDNTPKTGIDLLTTFHIELTDIRKQ